MNGLVGIDNLSHFIRLSSHDNIGFYIKSVSAALASALLGIVFMALLSDKIFSPVLVVLYK